MDLEVIKQELRLAEGKGLPGKPFQLYKDSRGLWSLGYGFLVDPSMGAQIPELVAEFWLDYKTKEAASFASWPWYEEIGVARQMLMVCLLYNMGPDRLAGFKKMLAALASGDYNTAARELQHSAWFLEVGDRGPRYVRIMQSNVWESL